VGSLFIGTTMKRTGETREVATVGQLETGQEGNSLPEDFPSKKKNGKWSDAADKRLKGPSFPSFYCIDEGCLKKPFFHYSRNYYCFCRVSEKGSGFLPNPLIWRAMLERLPVSPF